MKFISFLLIITVIFGFSLMPVKSFNLKNIEVKTEWPLTENQLLNKLSSFKNNNLIFLKLSSISATLNTIPWVKDVFIKKRFPNSILVKIETEKPVALFRKKDKLFFLNIDGKIIDEAKKELLKNSSYPIITFFGKKDNWHMPSVIAMLSSISKQLNDNVSELVLMYYPYFRIFLSSSHLEIEFDVKEWELQMPFLLKLLSNPMSQGGRLSKINLVLLKKAIVNSAISK